MSKEITISSRRGAESGAGAGGGFGGGGALPEVLRYLVYDSETDTVHVLRSLWSDGGISAIGKGSISEGGESSSDTSELIPLRDESGMVRENRIEYLGRVPMDARYVGWSCVLLVGDELVRYEFGDGIANWDFVPVEYDIDMQQYLVDSLEEMDRMGDSDLAKKALSARLGKEIIKSFNQGDF